MRILFLLNFKICEIIVAVMNFEVDSSYEDQNCCFVLIRTNELQQGYYFQKVDEGDSRDLLVN